MGSYVEARWAGSLDAPSRAGKRGGTFRCYVPDRLSDRPLVVEPALARRAQQTETTLRRLPAMSRGLEGLARFLLRSEAIASSRIEGLQVSPQQIALAELAQTDETVVRGFTTTARLVANNITSLARATTELAEAASIDVDGINRLHAALLPDERVHSLRDAQNWIGGSDWNPLDAEFVPPPPKHVEPLMRDLCDYLNGGLHAPLVQAALVHAQFETIHPYPDGNGRVGRALIHTVLVRRGVTTAVIPVSLVLLTRAQAYVAGLTAYRHDETPSRPAAHDAFAQWLTVFLDAVDVASTQVQQVGQEMADLTEEWRERLAELRTSRGMRPLPRAGSAPAMLLERLPELPMLTARTTQRLLGISFPAARSALEELAEARILDRTSVDRGTTGYLAKDVFDLLTFAERRLASTQWNTRESRPSRPVPAAPRY